LSTADKSPRKDPPAPRGSSGVNRRGAKRHRVTAPVRWAGGSGITRNISKTGLSFDTDSPLAAGRMLKIVLAAEDARPKGKAAYAFCDVLVLRVNANGDGTWRVACAFKQTRIDR
jgi:PilZ domain